MIYLICAYLCRYMLLHIQINIVKNNNVKVGKKGNKV
jgi:hypothetical protein